MVDFLPLFPFAVSSSPISLFFSFLSPFSLIPFFSSGAIFSLRYLLLPLPQDRTPTSDYPTYPVRAHTHRVGRDRVALRDSIGAEGVGVMVGGGIGPVLASAFRVTRVWE